jgi:DNA primase large subunit
MSTVDKSIADNLVRHNGLYDGEPEAPDNPRCYKIVKYTNAWGGESYGCMFEGHEPANAYDETHFVRNPVTYWEYKP